MPKIHDNRESELSGRWGLIPRLFEMPMSLLGGAKSVFLLPGRLFVLIGVFTCVCFASTLDARFGDAEEADSNSLSIILFDSISYDSYNPDTFLHTCVGIERGFRSMGFKGDLQVHRFGISIEPGTAYVSLHFYEYSPRRIRLIAFYVKDGERRKAGYYSQNLKVGLGPEEAPEWMIEQIGRRLMVELQNRFPDDFCLEPESNDAS